MIPALAFGQEGLGRPDRRQQTAGWREAVDVRAVFIPDEKAAVGQQRQRFAVDAHAAVRRLRQIRKTVRRATNAIRIESGERLSRRVRQQDGVGQRRRDAHLALRNRHARRIVERREGDEELVDARAIIARAGDVEAAIGQHIERALVAGGRSYPRFRIDRNGGAGAERLPELVAQIGRQPSNPDERLVDEGEIADDDSFGAARRRRWREPADQGESDNW